MDTGDQLAAAAVVISVAAAVVSVWQARTAASSADSARTQALAALEANRLAGEQMAQQSAREARQDSESRAAAEREAEAVRVSVASHVAGSLTLAVRNNSARPVAHVQLMEVGSEEPGPWHSWTADPHAGQLARTQYDRLRPEDSVHMTVWFLDDQGRQLARIPDHVRAEVRFRDADGQWWLTELTDGPRRVDAPEI